MISDLPTLQKQYPLLAAVNRCANGENHFTVIEHESVKVSGIEGLKQNKKNIGEK